MTTIIDSIKDWGIPTSSHFEAQRNLQKNTADYTQTQYELMIKELTNIDVKLSCQKEAQLVAHYLVIDSVKDFNNNINHMPSEAFDIAKQKAADYLTKNGWVLSSDQGTPSFPTATYEVGGSTPAPTTSAPGKKRTGPSKKDQSVALYNKDGNKDKSRKELIEIFMKELGLTEGGASTYVHNCKKGIWK